MPPGCLRLCERRLYVLLRVPRPSHVDSIQHGVAEWLRTALVPPWPRPTSLSSACGLKRRPAGPAALGPLEALIWLLARGWTHMETLLIDRRGLSH